MYVHMRPNLTEEAIERKAELLAQELEKDPDFKNVAYSDLRDRIETLIRQRLQEVRRVDPRSSVEIVNSIKFVK